MLLMGTAIIACLCSASSALSVGEEPVTIELLVGRLNAAEQAININQQELRELKRTLQAKDKAIAKLGTKIDQVKDLCINTIPTESK